MKDELADVADAAEESRDAPPPSRVRNLEALGGSTD